jgi:hypothetical protein
MNQSETWGDTSVDRRRFLRRAGTIAWATPVIVTLLTETAAASHPSGCIHVGAQCGRYRTQGSACQDTPGQTGSIANCCSPANCLPTTTTNNAPCNCT